MDSFAPDRTRPPTASSCSSGRFTVCATRCCCRAAGTCLPFRSRERSARSKDGSSSRWSISTQRTITGW